ncbi:LytR C-terminal domain-containing protein [Homoserinibacter sp. YIM 151385]|uniref:LytR C-terminal domain-containing protein n=1 Tax=Homoserinibacter sp. YIM 151385 TaxID=2985506 RepID=UPI0022EFE35B|nr:LytR C-terminal domain-containing protein [Homoserinibacter sp. YIM 151385]WBU37853.1 LytR C-terminal domain-containing protein [Homoserinibacter sp. YIM 151385]
MPSFPRDQFDEPSPEHARVGAHRAPKPPGRGWIGFAWAALATGVLVVGGLYGLSRFDENFALELPGFGQGEPAAPEPSVSQAPEVPAITDPAEVPDELDLSILVLNGTATGGLQDEAADALRAEKWPIGSTANSSSTDQAETIVYYRSADYEGVAKGLVEQLGVGRTQLSDAFPGAPVTIVVGADYAPAG